MNKKLFFAVFVVVSVLMIAGGVFAQLSDDVINHREKLKRELEALEAEIRGVEGQIDEKRKEATTLERDIAILDAKIKKTKLEIRAIDLQIKQLQDKITDKQSSIKSIVSKVDREKLSLAESLRTLAEYDDVSILEVMLAYERMSDFLGDVDAINTVQSSLQDSFDVLRESKREEEVARDEFVDQKREQSELRSLQELERKQLEKNELERKNLLKITRGKESEYKKVLTKKQKDAASIRTQLFLLQGSPAIPFERAVEYAEKASQKTGVRVAFILGVIAQESDLGKNVGQCNLPDDPPRLKWQKIMKPSRDQEPYKRITAKLGLDPDSMPLSCPMSVGYGGAMGPAQFIPSTWELYEAKIARATGHNPPNPWNPEDAFMASAIYLGELGADSTSGERTAAAKYFAGGNWKSSLGRTYANQVLAKVETYQGQIDIIRGVATR